MSEVHRGLHGPAEHAGRGELQMLHFTVKDTAHGKWTVKQNPWLALSSGVEGWWKSRVQWRGPSRRQRSWLAPQWWGKPTREQALGPPPGRDPAWLVDLATVTCCKGFSNVGATQYSLTLVKIHVRDPSCHLELAVDNSDGQMESDSI